jgi:oligopeptide/dipeptide ABC transporter ATP-binding protein
MQVMFQDPDSALDPRMPIGELVGEGLMIHHIGTVDDRRAGVLETMKRVGMEEYHARRYPYEFSGGQCQRIILKGDAPSPMNRPRGCRFHTRCPVAVDHCAVQDPQMLEIEPGHLVACWRLN